MEFRAYGSRERLAVDLAEAMAGELRSALLGGDATLSVPGGTTPGPVFDLLSRADLDWSRVAVLLNDERWVEESSPRSNTRLLRERLLVNRAAQAQLLPLHAPTVTPEVSLDRLADGIRPHLPVEVLLLGMGADMHTASLFPGADRLVEALADDAPILMPMRAEAAGEVRITLTAPVLRAAKHIHIMITGAEKRAALERAQGLPPEKAPVRTVLDRATVHWAE